MAIYHFSAKMISRANGSSALAAAAYRSASRLHDERLDRYHDFSNKTGVVHSEVMLPDSAPEEWTDREKLWNAAEATELRKDAQLAREAEFAIPRELDQEQGIRLAREFVAREFVARGMVADLNVHWDIGEDGLAKPHAHVMLTTRSIDGDAFGAKVRDWNRTYLLEHWREAWAGHVNARLAELDIDARIDHRSLEAQGIDLEPQHKIGTAASRIEEQGRESERLVEHLGIARANGERILANPGIALDAITHHQATFTTRDLAMFVHRHSDGKEQFDRVFTAVRASPELIALGKDGRGEERFTSRDMLETEQRLERVGDSLAQRHGHGLPAAAIDQAITAAGSDGLVLGTEQRAALQHIAKPDGLSIIVGYAGTGKSALLGVARDGWERAGYRVTGVALSGIAAENLESGSGIVSRTIASLEHQWSQGRELLSSRDILVVDEAGMIGTRQMERIVREAEKRGAKLVLVGDPEQLQAIEAGAAFRAMAERHGAPEISEIRRQREDWQRDATRHLATGCTAQAIQAYDEAGHVHAAETRDAARADLIERWDKDRIAVPQASRIILTHTNEAVCELNLAARERLRDAGALGEDVNVETGRGQRTFASGDRIMFLRNERGLSVKNGSLGIVEQIGPTQMTVRMDGGRSVGFDVKDYADIDHGYAATIHKAQGVTVDRVHVLATTGLDRHASYVALSRHRDRVDLHYGVDDFDNRAQLVRALSRERAKDMASDYSMERPSDAQVRNPFAGIQPREGPSAPEPERPRDPFAGLRLAAPPRPAERGEEALDRTVQRVARGIAELLDQEKRGLPELPHQRVALAKAQQALDQVKAHASHDLNNAFDRDPELIGEATRGRTAATIRAMQLETEIRLDPGKRADRFASDIRTLVRDYRRLERKGDEHGMREAVGRLTGMAKTLERDPQIESLLQTRSRELGLPPFEGRRLSQGLPEWLGLSRSRGLGR